jgi:formiminotetrahydrofolate cyclodeaminase
MLVMEKAFTGLEWVRIMTKLSSARLAPHLRVAAELLSAALLGTAHVVRENLRSIQSETKRNSYLARLETLCREGMIKKAEVLEAF